MAITVVPGQIVSSGDWDDLFKQHGGMPQTTQAVRRSRTEAEIRAAALAADDDPAAQQRPIYRYVLSDGSYVDARTSQDGAGWEVIDYKPSARFTASHPASGTSAGGTNTYIGTNPKTGKPSQVTEYPDGRPPTYDDTQVPASAAAQNIVVSTEGTPDDSKPGGWDNTRPRKVTRVVNPDGSPGRVVSSVELSGADLTAWRAEQQASQPQTGESRVAVPNRPGWTAVTRATAQGGNKTEATTYIGPDGKEVPSLPAEAPKDTAKPVVASDGKTYIEHTTTKSDGSPGEVYYTDQSGTRVPFPDTKKPGQVVTLNGESYWATPNADPSQSPTLTHLDPGTRPTDAGPQMAPGMSPSDYLNARRAWLMDQRQAGVSQKEINDIWDRDVQTAQQKQNEANTAATQQNQRLSTSMTGFNDALKTASDLASYAPVGSDIAGKGLEAFLTLQRGQAQRSGGYGPLVPPSAPTGPDPSSQVSAIPPPPASNPAVGPVAAGVTATNAAAINPTGPNVQAATDATVGGTNAAIGALGVPPPAPAPSGPVFRPQPPVDLPAPVSAIPESPYDFQARVASSPPWKLSEQDHQMAQAMGIEPSFWSVPVRAA